jgi:hypothetical protein
MDCRRAVAVVLLMFMALEILPCSYLKEPMSATAAPDSFACSIEPLQVCEQGDPLLGSLANLPVLVPGVVFLLLSPEVRCLVPDDASVALDGFRPSIDHPPQLSA